ALDVILISREFEHEEDELRRAGKVSAMIEQVLAGKTRLPEMIARRGQGRAVTRAFKVEPRVEIRNGLSHRFPVIEVDGRDWPGLVSAVTGAISDLSLDIASAHISTFGEKMIDTFYVTDLVGHKIEDPARQGRIRRRLLEVLEAGPAPRSARTPRGAA